MNKDLYTLLEQGYTCVTPTQRLGSHLRYQYAAMQLQEGKQAWETPDCLPWSAWIVREFQQTGFLQGEKVLINAIQRQVLWQRVIEQSSYSARLLHTRTTGKQAMAAWDLCHAYGIRIFPDDCFLNEDALAFGTWAGEYENQLIRNNYIDEATLPGLWVQCLDKETAGKLRVALYGFDVLTPQQQNCVEQLHTLGAGIKLVPLEKKSKSIHYLVANDRLDEIRRLAFWCRDQLIRNPDQRIGVICPRLHEHRARLVHTFDTVLCPGLLAGTDKPGGKPYEKPYSITLGLPLSHYPVIHSALNILGLARQRIELVVLSSVLRSPFISGANAELDTRSGFDAMLRERGEQELTLKTILWIAAGKHIKSHQQCRQFVEKLKAFNILFLSSAKSQPPRHWAITFSELLKQFGWPGERTLTSDEYQTVDAWQQALSQLCSLEPVTGKTDFNQALSHLTRILNETSFQPQTGETPVQIMGETAASGMQFDQLWFMDCHDRTWPPVQYANPFVPLSLQRDFNVPHASAENQLTSARQLTQQLVKSATSMIFSYPQQVEDYPARPSPLIKSWLEAASPVESEPVQDYPTKLYHSGLLEILVDDHAPPIPAGELVSGGSSIFRDQSLCPFRAFARHRLFAQGLKTVETGLDPAQRGQLVHDVMENFWNRVRDSDSLKNYSGQQLEKITQAAIQRTIKHYAKVQPDTFTPVFCELEAQRLGILVNEWISLELHRPAFRVQETEQWHTVELADIQVRLKLDRIDECQDGALIIIDYKTGQASSSEWLQERPGDPQLPLYAITTQGHVAALVFAKIKRGECRFDGFAEVDTLLPPINVPGHISWSELLESWRMVMQQLAIEYRQGIASVTPRDQQACRQCDLHGLCRIYEKCETLGVENE